MRLGRETWLSVEVELGEPTVTMLSDGATVMPVTDLCGEGGVPLEDLAGAELVAGKLRLPVRAFPVRRREGCLLIDAGAGDAWHPTLGRLYEAMLAAGVRPLEVTAVALTRTDVDHLGGLVTAGHEAALPNAARIFVATEELTAFRAIPRMLPVLPTVIPLEQGDGPIR